jgi:hypothetical protein
MHTDLLIHGSLPPGSLQSLQRTPNDKQESVPTRPSLRMMSTKRLLGRSVTRMTAILTPLQFSRIGTKELIVITHCLVVELPELNLLLRCQFGLVH